MSHEIESIDHHWSGDTLHLTFRVLDGDSDEDEWKNLEGAEIEWWLSPPRSDDRVLEGDDDDVDVSIIDINSGHFEVRIDAEATADLGGKTYSERLRIMDDDGRLSSFGAEFTIDDI